MYLVYLLNLVILTNYVTAQWTLNLIDLKTYPLARCLDGTPAGYYISPGTGDDAANILWHTQGGGWRRRPPQLLLPLPPLPPKLLLRLLPRSPAASARSSMPGRDGPGQLARAETSPLRHTHQGVGGGRERSESGTRRVCLARSRRARRQHTRGAAERRRPSPAERGMDESR